MYYEGVLHMGSDNFLSRYEFAMEIAEIFGFKKSLIIPIKTKMLYKNIESYVAKRPRHSGLIIDKVLSSILSFLKIDQSI